MSSRLLPAFIESALALNADLLPRVRERKATLDEVLELCRNHRIAGIGMLLLLGDVDDFRRQLHGSARACLDLLKGAAEAPIIASRTVPFFDALAARDFECARDIARHSRRTWARGVEYEEDFLYMEFLMGHFFRELPEPEAEALLQRYEVALQGTDDVRLDVCRALLARRGDALDAALDRMMAERAARQERLREKGALSEEAWATECQVSVEGLALVALAERAGMEVRSNHLFIPSLAREGGPPPRAPER